MDDMENQLKNLLKNGLFDEKFVKEVSELNQIKTTKNKSEKTLNKNHISKTERNIKNRMDSSLKKNSATSDTKIIKYQNQVYSNGEYFVNPYNFVSLGDTVSRINRDTKEYSDRLLTGSVNCTLMTKTPIFIPNISNDNAFEKAEKFNKINEEQKTQCEGKKEKHKNYDFFSYSDLSGKNTENDPQEPIIPGSSIRGVIRSAFEALTDSCMMTSDRLITGRSKIPNKPGIIQKTDDGKWILYEAKASKINVNGSKGHRYTVKIGDCKYIEDKNNKYYSYNEERYDISNRIACNIGSRNAKNKGYLVLSYYDKEKSTKKYDYIFKKQNKMLGEVTNEVALLEKVLEVYNSSININLNTSENTKGYHFGYRDFKLDKNKAHHPVWYNNKITGKIYLAPACISRIAFNKTITEILKNSGEYDSCSDANKLCDACELFGMVGDKTSLGSKIRFSDARLSGEYFNKYNCYEEIMTLDELSSPKPSAVEFYTKRPKVDFFDKKVDAHSWNYDYSVMLNGKKPVQKELDNLEVLGRKYYWHSSPPRAIKFKENDLKISVLNTTVRPVKDKVKFNFDIYFERITEKELKRLIWVLTIGENEIEGNRCHKIGSAKPLGFGSIKIKVNQIKKRIWTILEDGTIIRKYELINVSDMLDDNSLPQSKAKKEFLAISNFNCMQGQNVRYPFGEELQANGEPTGVENDEGGHVWFKLNRLAKNSNSTELLDDIKYVLNDILHPDQCLPFLRRKEE